MHQQGKASFGHIPGPQISETDRLTKERKKDFRVDPRAMVPWTLDMALEGEVCSVEIMRSRNVPVRELIHHHLGLA